MRKIAFATLAVAGLFICNQAEANQGFFGGRPTFDSSINLRRSTTEQFDPIRGQSVAQRPRPDFDPIPIEVGSFQLFPALSVASYYDTNIYAAPTTQHDDVVWKVDPTVALVSNWGRHALAITGLGDINAYTNHNEENFNSGALQAEGRFDITEQTWLQATAGFEKVTEPRSSPSILGSAAEPSQYDLFTAGAEAYRGLGDLKAKANYDFSLFDYSPVALTGGGTASQDARDRVYNKGSTEISYDISENLKPFFRGSFEQRDYNQTAARSSQGITADVGARVDLGGITTGEVYAGWMDRDYYNFTNGDVGTFDLGGRVLWNVTEITSVEGEVSRSIEETTLGGSPGVIDTGGSVTVTHELRRNIILEGNASYSNYDFVNNPRSDDNYGAGVGMRYFINRNLYADTTYDYNKRDSNVAGGDYDRHIVLIRLGAQY